MWLLSQESISYRTINPFQSSRFCQSLLPELFVEFSVKLKVENIITIERYKTFLEKERRCSTLRNKFNQCLTKRYRLMNLVNYPLPIQRKNPKKQRRRTLKKYLRKLVNNFIPRKKKYAIYEEVFEERNSFSKTGIDAKSM